jgi:hypothetical protein
MDAAAIAGLFSELAVRFAREKPGRDPPPDETTLLSPESGPSPAPYKWGIIGNHDRTLEPLIPTGSTVLIDTQKREISPHKDWARELQRPIYFLTTGDAYFCGWCEFDPLGNYWPWCPIPFHLPPAEDGATGKK